MVRSCSTAIWCDPADSVNRVPLRLRRFALAGWIVVLLAGPSCALGDAASLEQRIENASLELEFDNEGGHVIHAKVSDGALGMIIWKPDSSVALGFDSVGNRLFRISTRDAGHRRLKWVEMSDDASTFVVAEATGPELHRFHVVNADGTIRFESSSYSTLHPSPDGLAFFRGHVGSSNAPFALFDANGREITRLPNLDRGWNCRFLDEERLIVADGVSARILDATTGQQMRLITLQLSDSRFYPGIVVGEWGYPIAVYDPHTLILLSSEGDELWRVAVDDYLCEVAIDSHDSLMALLVRLPAESRAELRLVKTSHPSPPIAVCSLHAMADAPFSYVPTLEMVNNLITMWGPPSSSFSTLYPEKDYWTLFIEFDPESKVLSQPVRSEGLCRRMTTQGADRRYLRLGEQGSAQIINIRTTLQGDTR